MLSEQIWFPRRSTLTHDPDNPFWRFSLAVYARPGVPPACLALQASHGADVNLLLYVCWLASRGVALMPEDIVSAGKAVAAWHREVVIPLRRIRTTLKDGYAGLDPSLGRPYRDGIKKTELEAEQLEQAMLHALPLSARDASVPAAGREVSCRTALNVCLAQWTDTPADDAHVVRIAAAAVSVAGG
jgi:uncharacterized protein (TIGR02444 family)